MHNEEAIVTSCSSRLKHGLDLNWLLRIANEVKNDIIYFSLDLKSGPCAKRSKIFQSKCKILVSKSSTLSVTGTCFHL